MIDRFGPDILWTHWILHFKWIAKLLFYSQFKRIGKNVEIRPYETIVGANIFEIGDNVVIRPFTQIHAGKNALVKIKEDVLVALGVFITTNNHQYLDKNIPISSQGGDSRAVTIEKGAWIAANAIILPGVRVGENSVVAAGSVVTKDV